MHVMDPKSHQEPSSSSSKQGQTHGHGDHYRMWHQLTASLGLRNTTMDRTVASQVLMYRQLLHTKCRPGLRLSRPYEGTAAQRAVIDMPWWERGILTSNKMVISYDNLIERLWVAAAIRPYDKNDDNDFDLLSFNDDLNDDTNVACQIPHEYWVKRIGFQQEDPVTDFRSGGVLSLALCVHLVESCNYVHRRFCIGGDTEVMPFGITSINVTDMLAKMLMFSKNVDKMDALVSSKPFWKMFADPHSLLVLQEVSMDALCDITNEIRQEKGKVTVFDFNSVMEETERRVQSLLGYGPETVTDLRQIYLTMKERYNTRTERKRKQMLSKNNDISEEGSGKCVHEQNGTNLQTQFQENMQQFGSITSGGMVKVGRAVGTVGMITGSLIGSAGSTVLSKFNASATPATVNNPPTKSRSHDKNEVDDHDYDAEWTKITK